MIDTIKLKEYLDSEAGKNVKEFLTYHYSKLNNINDMRVMETPAAQMIEFKARKKALGILDDILGAIITIESTTINGRQEQDVPGIEN